MGQPRPGLSTTPGFMEEPNEIMLGILGKCSHETKTFWPDAICLTADPHENAIPTVKRGGGSILLLI